MTIRSVSDSARFTLATAKKVPPQSLADSLEGGVATLGTLAHADRSLPKDQVTLIDDLVTLGKSCHSDPACLQAVLTVAAALGDSADKDALARAAMGVVNARFSLLDRTNSPFKRLGGEARCLQTGAEAVAVVARAVPGPAGQIAGAICSQALAVVNSTQNPPFRRPTGTATLEAALVTVANVGEGDRQHLRQAADSLLKIRVSGETLTELLQEGVQALTLAAQASGDEVVQAILHQERPEARALEDIAHGDGLLVDAPGEAGSITEDSGQVQIGDVSLPRRS